MKVAIIGAGVSGLVAAYRLHTSHEITVFEANHYLGGHTNTVNVVADGNVHPIDTGFIVYNDWTYPNFIRLLDELGVKSQPTSMSFSVADERTGLEYNGESLNSLFAQRWNLVSPRFYRMLADILRFNRIATRAINKCSDQTTVAEFLHRHAFSRQFAEQYLLPMGSAIWSCPVGTFSQFPIRFIVEFYHNHGLLSIWRRPTWRVISGGSQTYVRAMTSSFQSRIRIKTPIKTIRRYLDQVEVKPVNGPPEVFDHVIFACHSDQALQILKEEATPTERELLGAFPYQRNVAVLHTDVSVLPKSRRAWASWNYRIQSGESNQASVTYNMNILQQIRASETFCVTLNDEARITPQRVLQKYEYHHPIFTHRRAAAQKRHSELLNANRTSFCGAYWGNGFHEDGVKSALAVVDSLTRQTSTDGLPRTPPPFMANVGGISK